MIYLSGAIRPELHHDRLGWMLTYRMGQLPPLHGYWALDNACYSRSFDYDRFRRHAQRSLAIAADRCLFVVVPDVPFDADGTIARWHQYQQRIASLGRPLAFVTQDGMGVEDVPFHEASAIFVGGSTQWKLSHESTAIIAAAKRRGCWVHVGRVNSLARLRTADATGADSADGTYLKYGPNRNWPRLRSWLEHCETQPVLELGA